jgi:hypothetical protein
MNKKTAFIVGAKLYGKRAFLMTNNAINVWLVVEVLLED